MSIRGQCSVPAEGWNFRSSCLCACDATSPVVVEAGALPAVTTFCGEIPLGRTYTSYNSPNVRTSAVRPPFNDDSDTTIPDPQIPCRHTIRVAERTTFISLCVLIDIANGLQARMHRRIVSLVYVSQLQVHTGTEYCVHMHMSTNMRRHCSSNGPSALSTVYYRQPH